MTDTNTFLATAASASANGSNSASGAADHFLINPWIGIIVLCALVITGAVAVIREIRIEDEENNS